MDISCLDFLPDHILASIDVDPDSSHLLWTGSTNHLGYPRVGRNGKLVTLSRWIAEEVHGPPPTPKHQAGHTCHDDQIDECPLALPGFDFHRLCCNPDHIQWQTARENCMASTRTIAYRRAHSRRRPASWHRSSPKSDYDLDTNAMYEQMSFSQPYYVDDEDE